MVSNSLLSDDCEKQSLQGLLKIEAVFLIKLCISSRATFFFSAHSQVFCNSWPLKAFNESWAH